MQFGLTIPLQKYLKRKAPPYGEPCDLFYCWEVHKIQLQGRSTLVAANASNRFAVVLCGMGSRDWKALEERLSDGIRRALKEEGYSEKQIDGYFQAAGEITITKTHGRKSVAGLNRMDEYLWMIPVPIENDCLLQSIHIQEANRKLCHAAGFADYGYPVELWEADMKRTGLL